MSDKITLYWKSSCSTCRKARRSLQDAGVAFEELDYSKQVLPREVIADLLARHDVSDVLNSRNEMYRERKLRDNPPTRGEALELIVHEPNLLRRPVLVRGKRAVFGFDPEKFAALLK